MRKIYANLKSVLAAVAMVAMLSTAVLSASCSAEYDDTQIKNQLNELTQRVDALESDFEALQSILTEGVLTAEQDADGNWVITTPDGTVEITVEGANEGTITIVEQDGAQYWAVIENGNPVVVAPVMEKPEFRSNPATGMAEISFDGNTWYAMGGALISNIAVEGNTLVLTIGGYDVVVPMAEEIVFDIRVGGLVTFSSEETKSIAIKTQAIEDLSILATPKGWYAEVSEGVLTITAPNEADTEDEGEYDDDWNWVVTKPAAAAAEGYVKVHANTADGKCLVGKVKVKIGSGASVSVYGGTAYIYAPVQWGYANMVLYGAAKRSEYEAMVDMVFETLANNEGWSLPEFPEGIYTNEIGYYEYAELVEKPVAELLGYEPVAGEEYTVWALDMTDMMEVTKDMVTYAHYSPVVVTVTEDESKRTAFNIDITIEVKGADEYIALVVPDNYCEDEEAVAYNKEQIASYYAQYEQAYGVLYTESYTGTIEGVTADTGYSMTGNYAPDQTWYVFIMPIDGRPIDAYTADAVQVVSFKTAELQPGGAVNATMEQITEYMGEVFSYDDWQYHEQLIKLDAYSELGVKVTPSSDEWIAFYCNWYSAADLAAMPTDEAKIESLLGTYSILPEDVDFNIVEKNIAPGVSMTLLCLFVDKDGKYGELGQMTLTTQAIEYSEITLSVESNLVSEGLDYQLRNTSDLEFTLTPSAEASKYRVLKRNISNYNVYEGLTNQEITERIVLAGEDDGDFTWYNAADLTDNKLVLGGHEFGSNYIAAILPYDAEGKPGKTALVYNYACSFFIENVITEGDAYTTSEPTVTLQEMTDLIEVGNANFDWNSAYFEYTYSDYYENWRYNFDIYYEVEVAGATKVYSILWNDESGEISAMTANQKASGVIANDFSSYYTNLTVETTATPDGTYYRSMGWYKGLDYPVYLMVAWEDAEGQVYYKEYNVNDFLAPYIAKMDKATGSTSEETLEVGGKQWLLPVSVAAGVVGSEARSVLDLGVTASETLCYGVSYEDIYGSDAAGMWVTYGGMGGYTVEATDATSGVVKLTIYNQFEEEITTEIPYQNLTETTCEFDLENLLGVEGYQIATLSEEVIPVQAGGIMM